MCTCTLCGGGGVERVQVHCPEDDDHVYIVTRLGGGSQCVRVQYEALPATWAPPRPASMAGTLQIR